MTNRSLLATWSIISIILSAITGGEDLEHQPLLNLACFLSMIMTLYAFALYLKDPED